MKMRILLVAVIFVLTACSEPAPGTEPAASDTKFPVCMQGVRCASGPVVCSGGVSARARDGLFMGNADYSRCRCPDGGAPVCAIPGAGLTFQGHKFGEQHFVVVKAVELVRGYPGDEDSDSWLDAGNQWVKVVVEVKNLGEDDFSASHLNFALTNANNEELGDDFGPLDTGNLLIYKDIEPGGTVQGDVVMQSPASASYLALKVRRAFFGSQYLPLTTGAVPFATPPPSATPAPTATAEPTPTLTPTPVYDVVPTEPTWIGFRKVDFPLGTDFRVVSWGKAEGATWYETGQFGNVDAPDTEVRDKRTCYVLFTDVFCGTGPYKVRACNDVGCSDWISTAPLFESEYSRRGKTIVVSWDAVAGADYYKIYYAESYRDSYGNGCRVNAWGEASFCEVLADRVEGTSYTHTSPDDHKNYYWITACNEQGCSHIQSNSPAEFFDTRPASPANTRYRWDGSTIVVSWGPVEGADYYKIHHCRFYRQGERSFCDELADKVEGTSYIHTSPEDAYDGNNYWIRACNEGGCSPIQRRDRPALLRPGY